MNQPVTRVLVVDDHSMVRGGLRLFLMAFEDMVLVGEAANGRDALRLCEQAQPDVVLMDLIMPVMDGIQATREIHRLFPKVLVIGLTSFLDAGILSEAIQAGLTGLLTKEVSAAELVKAIRDVRAGRAVFSEPIAALLETHTGSSEARQADEASPEEIPLTARELEVLALLVSGASNAEVAQRLVISLSTAKYHVSAILEKLHVNNRAEAVALALQHGLVPLHQPNEPGKKVL